MLVSVHLKETSVDMSDLQQLKVGGVSKIDIA